MFVTKKSLEQFAREIIDVQHMFIDAVAEQQEAIDTLWDAVAALEAIVYAEKAAPARKAVKAPVKPATVATPTRTKKA